MSQIPYRVDIAGGWLDQPKCSKFCGGMVIVASLEPDVKFAERSGMATSTRYTAKKIWPDGLPDNEPRTAHTLFCVDNPPGTVEVSGSQDALGIVLPGISSLYYSGEYWPESITTLKEEKYLSWLEDRLYFVELEPRPSDYDVQSKLTNISPVSVADLVIASYYCWVGLMDRHFVRFSSAMTASLKAQARIFPATVPDALMQQCEQFAYTYGGAKLSGAGGGGYMIVASEKEVPGGFQVKIRREGTK